MRNSFFAGFLFFVWLAVAVPAGLYADHAIHINTADKATLTTLSGIGEVKAQAIIDYRTQHGPFATIEDIMNVSGIGTATFNGIKDHITVSETTALPATEAEQSTTTQVVVTSGSSPPPIRVSIEIDPVSVVGAGSFFEAAAYGQKGEPLSADVRYVWTFGDGASAEGRRVFHAYSYPGTYALQVSVAYNYSSAVVRETVRAVPGDISFVVQPDGSLLLANRSDLDINIGLWSLAEREKTFVIPANTYVLAGEGVRFSPALLGFAAGSDALVRYPNGTRAYVAAPSADSPLRGERVALPVASTQADSGLDKPPPSAVSSSLERSDMLAATAHATGVKGWGPWAGLGLLLGLGAAGAYYTRPRRETPVSAEEFDIVD